MVALPRMIRHGWLPPQLAPYLTGLCDETQLADAVGMQQQPDGSWVFPNRSNPNGNNPNADYYTPAPVPPIYAEPNN